MIEDLAMEFVLEVELVSQICLVRLRWGKGYSLNSQMDFPLTFAKYYDDWSYAYHQYYAQAESSRGRPGIAVNVAALPINLETRLNFTENELINEFRAWLRGREWFEIRQVLVKASQTQNTPINLLVQCQDDSKALDQEFSLVKLPWECLGPELSDRMPIQVLRTTRQRPVKVKRISRSKLRILAIFGDETGLNFQDERKAIQQTLKSIATVQFVGHNLSPSHPQINLKAQIKQAIEDPRGWDILFFAGHSDEDLGGEIMLAPGYSALVDEFGESLKLAREQGLQFALFNSCRGCAIAEKLIHYGLSHVVVMRERVTNRVAQEFFQAFADRLANLQDVQTAAIGATQALASKAKEHYQYPSAYLVPSIYAYSGVKPLKPPPLNFRVVLSRLNPTRREAIVLIALAILSCQTSIQYPLINARQVGQAIYRDMFSPPVPLSPPIVLVKIDDASLNQAGIIEKDPIDRGYLAQLVQKTIDLKAPIVGIDYVLKDSRPKQNELRQLLDRSSQTQFILGASGKWGRTFENVMPREKLVDGNIDVNNLSNAIERYPVFLARTIGSPSVLSQPTHPFPQQIFCVQTQSPNCTIPDAKAYYHPITAISDWLNLHWFAPWIDYSVDRSQVYQTVTAKEFLNRQTSLENQITLLVPGEEFDDFIKPRSLNYHLDEPPEKRSKMAGGEIHAYQLYNLLHRGLITPIPDLWMIGLVGILGKLFSLSLAESLADRSSIPKEAWGVFIGLPLFAYVFGFFVYRVVAISIPLFFPLLVYGSYLAPHLLRHWKQVKPRSSHRSKPQSKRSR